MTNKVLEKMIEYFGADTQRINHALKVYSFSGCIARSEMLSEEELLIIDVSAILHDIGIKEAEKKYNSCIGKYQEKEGPVVAQTLLSEFGFNNEVLDRIYFIIGNHHTYSKIDGIDFQILVEADFLVNIFEDKISMDAVKTIRKKYFKTQSGISILESMYIR